MERLEESEFHRHLNHKLTELIVGRKKPLKTAVDQDTAIAWIRESSQSLDHPYLDRHTTDGVMLFLGGNREITPETELSFSMEPKKYDLNELVTHLGAPIKTPDAPPEVQKEVETTTTDAIKWARENIQHTSTIHRVSVGPQKIFFHREISDTPSVHTLTLTALDQRGTRIATVNRIKDKQEHPPGQGNPEHVSLTIWVGRLQKSPSYEHTRRPLKHCGSQAPHQQKQVRILGLFCSCQCFDWWSRRPHHQRWFDSTQRKLSW